MISFTIAAIVVAVMAWPISAHPQSTLVPPSPPSPGGDYVAGEILVKFKPQINMLSANNTLRAEGLRALEVSPYDRVMRVQVAPGREAEVIGALQAQENVEFATFNHHIQAAGDPNDPYYGNQWALKQTQDHDIDAPEAWDLHTGSSDVTIAIIDTGVDLDHPDLGAKIVTGYDYVNHDSIPDDDNGHGTHVAGIAAAIGNNGIGIAGVSWGASIMPLKVLDATGSGSTYNLSQAIYYAVDNGARVINMSLSDPTSSWPCDDWSEVENAFNYALNHGVLLAAAAGNLNQPKVDCPAALDQAIAVGSTTSSDTRSSFSNFGPRLDIAAPGSSIYSTIPPFPSNGYTYYGYKSGTSMATPHVAGLAALLWSFAPDLAHDQVRSIIQSTADDLGTPGWDQEYGHGRINAWRALKSISLQASPAQTQFLIDDDSGPFPASWPVDVTTPSPDIITWTATISPSVSWLGVTPPVSGTVSAASSDRFTLVVPTRPATYGIYTTTVVVTGTTSSGAIAGPSTIEARINYVADLNQSRLPIILKIYAP